MLKIYHNPLSPPSCKVRYCANLLGLEHEGILVDLYKGEQVTEEFLKLNPFGKVPVIDDDGFVLFESDAIIRYLCRKQKSALYPSTYKQRARVDQWMDFSSMMLQMAVNKVFGQRLIMPRLGREPDQSQIDMGEAQFARYMPVYENLLSENKFVCGDEFTIADLALLSATDPVSLLNMDTLNFSAFNKWRKRLTIKAFYTDVHSHYGQGFYD